MIDTILLAAITALLTLVGTLGLLAYKDISRRILTIEEGYQKMNAALITIGMIMISKEPDSDAMAKVLTNLMTNGAH